jgi:phosphoribosylaminoimidazolecarboxamide formyltransferase/IMP cyclohydrolase
MSNDFAIKRALLSVSDKSGIVDLAKVLIESKIEIISSGGTAKVLTEAGIPVTPVENVTGNPEAFGGRMKTLSFQISSALLYRRDSPKDIEQAKELEIEAIDLVVCNLYPFGEVVKNKGSFEELVENIDIGGPTMVRASAKNHKSVATLTSPLQYASFCKELKESGVTHITRKRLALEAFSHTAAYDVLISQVLESEITGKCTSYFGQTMGPHSQAVRYGENPHQAGFVLVDPKKTIKTLANSTPLQGKALSYNNYLDADAAWRCNSDLVSASQKKKCVTIIKHSNPCGAACSDSLSKALELAWAGDPISSFGSIIAFSDEVDETVANFFGSKFVEVLIAPSFSEAAKEIFSKKKNLRLIELAPGAANHEENELMIRTINGGHIVQHEDHGQEEQFNIVSGDQSLFDNKSLVEFGLKVTKHLNSNAIALVSLVDGSPCLLGAGMGNPNRLVSLDQAVEKARENGHDNLSQAILISDAFFPFRDNIDKANGFGIKAIIQPGGSIKDSEVISACEEFGISMMLTGMRHFRH